MSNLVLTEGQEKAMKMIQSFMASEALVAVLTGFAGTGKTTMIKEVVDQFSAEIITPTGKAALRAMEATGKGAQTIHRLLYTAKRDDETGEMKFVARPPTELTHLKGCLVIVDEASMVSRDVFNNLVAVMKFVGGKLLFVGDTFQLPPVSRDDEVPFSALEVATDYKAALTEIVRQALDNPIVRASMLIRQNCEDYETLTLLHAIPSDELDSHIIELRERGGVGLCYTNAKRNELNSVVRRALGYTDDVVEPGEPLLVLKNNYGVDRYNGEVIDFLSWSGRLDEKVVVDRWKNSSMTMRFGEAMIEGDQHVVMSPEQMSGKTEIGKIGDLAMTIVARNLMRDKYGVEDYDDAYRAPLPPLLLATYGYVLTVHKSQGSEWPEVTVFIEPSLARRRDKFRARFLYTAVTRGKKVVNYCYT